MDHHWFAHIDGDKFDLSDCERLLKAPFEPYCERINWNGAAILVLRSQSFNALNTSDQVRERANILVERVNGALAIEANGAPVTLKGVGTVDANGHVQMFVAATGHARGRSHAVSVSDNAAPKPKPTAIQEWIAAADKDDNISDLLTFAARADNWFDIYKTHEVADAMTAPGKGAKALSGCSTEYGHMLGTANFYRHGRYKGRKPTLPATPITPSRARNMVLAVAKQVLCIRKHLP